MDSKYLARRFTPLLVCGMHCNIYVHIIFVLIYVQCGATSKTYEKLITLVVHRCIHSPTSSFLV